jgi:hypothetical protein
VSVQERIEALSGKPPVQMKIKPPGHALEDESSVDQSDPGKFAKAKRAPPMPRFEAREAGFATLGGDATEEGLKGFVDFLQRPAG